MTSRQMSVAEAPAAEPTEEIIEITDDMILELEPRGPRGKLLHFPPPVPRADQLTAPARPLPAPRRRRRGVFRTV